MKALTLWQPHAYLIGRGVKPFETRSWKTNYRGLLAIHAAKIRVDECDALTTTDEGCSEPRFIYPFSEYLPDDWGMYWGETNHGGIESIVRLDACYPAPSALAALRRGERDAQTEEERTWWKHAQAFGNFSPGRWAWQLTPLIWLQGFGGVVAGHQGLWTLPADHEFTIRAMAAGAGAYLTETDRPLLGYVQQEAA